MKWGEKPTFICSVNAVVHIKTNPMTYTVTDLTTLGACDAFLSEKNQDITRMQVAISNLDLLLGNASGGQSLLEEIQEAELKVTNQEAHVAQMAEGRDRRRQERILRDYQDDLSRLLDREESTGPAARIERELRLANLQDNLANLQEAVAEVTAHRASLEASGIAA